MVNMCSKRQPENLTFGLHEYLPELSYERIDDGQTKFTYTQFTEHNLSIFHSHVCFAQLPFAKKRENFGRHYFHCKFHNNCKHTYSSRNWVRYHHIAISLVFFSWEDVRVSDTQMLVCYWQKTFIVSYMETLAAILPAPWCHSPSQKVITKSGPPILHEKY